MTRLEALGFMVASARWLELNRQQSAILVQLVLASPRVVEWEGFTGARGEPLARLVVQNKLPPLRRALAEVGAPGRIETEIGVGLRFVGDVAALKAEVEARA